MIFVCFFVTAKPKQNARNAAKQTSGPQQNAHQNNNNNNNQKSTATPVPQSQPPKSSNKSHKKIDINQKGANKEGTDMDAFNDNIREATPNNISTTTATITTTPMNNTVAINDIINANSHLSNNISTGVVVNNNSMDVNKTSVNNEINNKFESNDSTNNSSNMTIKTISAVTQSQPPQAQPQSQLPPPPSNTNTTTGKPKTNKVDVTSIVREQPKVLTKLLPASNNNSTDETDRAAPQIDVLNASNNNNSKLTTSIINSEQTANNANAANPKTNSETINRIEIKLPYQEGKTINIYTGYLLFIYLLLINHFFNLSSIEYAFKEF